MDIGGSIGRNGQQLTGVETSIARDVVALTLDARLSSLRPCAELGGTRAAGDRPHLEKGIDDRALRNLIALALRRHVRHRPLQPLQVDDLPTDIPEMFDGQRVDLRTGEGVPVNQAEQVTQSVEA